MNSRACFALFAALMPSLGWGTDVGVYGTTLAQLWKQDAPGFDKSTFAPATQYLGIDATQMGDGNLSLHFFGWGRRDLADQSLPSGKGGGDLTLGYLRYRFSKANAELKLGRFAVTEGIANDLVDGLMGRADLRGGLAFTFFGGRPVRFGNLPSAEQKAFEQQRNFIAGGRLSIRVPKIMDLGISYVQDGKAPSPDPSRPEPVDYSRRFMGTDIRIAPHPAFELSGRTLFNAASRPIGSPRSGDTRLAEHDYTLNVRLSRWLSCSGNFTERNFLEYFQGTNLPSLFHPLENDKHSGYGGSFTLGNLQSFSLVADYRHTHRETYGNAIRWGGDLRWNLGERRVQSGVGYHRVAADDVPLVGARIPAYGLSHHELRVWIMHEGRNYSVSLDGIQHRYDDRENPSLNGRTSVYEVVGSLGYRPTHAISISGDVTYGANAAFQNEVRGLLRTEFRFGFGGRK